MPDFFIYLLKVNTALLLFYLVYRFVLRRLTFYRANRWYLLFAVFFSSIFPLVNISGVATHLPASTLLYYSPGWNKAAVFIQQEADGFSIWRMLFFVYWTGVAVMLAAFIRGCAALWRIYRESEHQPAGLVQLRISRRAIMPFSFWNLIFVNPDRHSPDELDTILAHESVHARERHSVDLLLGEINRIFYWFNPGAWLFKNAIRENLEFIADDRVLRMGGDIRTYQYQLLQTATGMPVANGITSRFAFSHLKNRIKMMNRKRSGGRQRLRYMLLLPLLFVVLAVVARRPQPENLRGTLAQLPGATALPGDSTPPRLAKPDAGYRMYYNSKGYAISVQTLQGHATAIVADRRGNLVAKTRLDAGDAAIKAFENKYGSIPPPPPPPPGRPEKKGDEPVAVRVTRPSGVLRADTLVWVADQAGKKSGAAWKSLTESVLYVLDGKVVAADVLESLPPNQIQRIDVLKGDKAVKEYGDAGRNGVMLITSKPAASAAGGEVVVMGYPEQGAAAVQAANDLPEAVAAQPAVYRKVDKEASFNGNFRKFLEANLRYPVNARDNKIKGIVITEFIVDLNGDLSEIRLAHSSPSRNEYLAAEAKRVITLSSGNWRPATVNGKPVRSHHSQSLNFVLAN